MTVSTKGKRKISVNGKSYLWKAFNENDQSWFEGVQVMIVAEDQSILMRYGSCQTNEMRHIVVQEQNSKPIKYSCPKFESEENIFKPEQIKNIIEFSVEKNNENT